jgi:hypothetical protein
LRAVLVLGQKAAAAAAAAAVEQEVEEEGRAPGEGEEAAMMADLQSPPTSTE